MTNVIDRPRVLLVFPLPDAQIEAAFAERVEIVRPASRSVDDLVDAVRDVEALITRGVGATISAQVIEAGTALRVVCAVGSGTDNIDIAAATRLGIPVIHGAGVAPRAVAEYVIAGMVVGHRHLFELHDAVVSGGIEWATRVERFFGTELTGRPVGIIGLGNIGREVARAVRAAFDAEVIAYDPFLGPATVEGVEMVEDLGELLDRSLSVSVHVPALPQTMGMLGREELRRIGPEGVLVDAARGGIVDEEALIEALYAGDLKGAVIDVYEGEPPTPEQARRLGAVPNLVLTPHVAGVTDQSLAGLSRGAVEGVLAVLGGAAPDRVVVASGGPDA
jgi:phosphoglycerate dehydrogenase-like enzyme